MNKSKRMYELYANPISATAKYRLSLLLEESIDKKLINEFYDSKWVNMLRKNQQKDGGYGRFHSQNSKIRQKYSTTERAIDAMKVLGVRRGDDLVDRVCNYMEGLLDEEIEWPDGYEKNKWYKAAQPIFVASKLSVFGSNNKNFIEKCDVWIEILNEAFKDGNYNAMRTNTISEKFLGCAIDRSYISLNSLYVMELFSNICGAINDSVQKSYLAWLHKINEPICYTGVELKEFHKIDFSVLYKILFILSKFSPYKEEFFPEIAKLKQQYCVDGLWDFGTKFIVQKLSDDWRRTMTRICDHSILAWMVFLE